jgi:membrane protein
VVALGGLFYYVPNTHVRWRHALAGAVFSALGFELAKSGMAWYLGSVATYATVYGAFASAPIFLLWLYLGWVIVLLGAVVAAYAPSLQMHAVRLPSTPGHRFALALSVLGQLAQARGSGQRGMALPDIAAALRTDPLQVEPVLDELIGHDWVARLDEGSSQRHVLLCDPHQTPATALIDRLLLAADERVQAFRARAGFERLSLADLLS